MTAIINANNSGITQTVDLTASVAFQTANTNALLIDSTQNINCASTAAIIVPAGTTANRPTASSGMLRYNTSNSVFETYSNGNWSSLTQTFLPINSVAPVISGTVTVGQTLTSTTGTWSNTPTSYGYQWRANSVNITSATSNTFVLTSTQSGSNMTCNVTATNAAGTANAITSNSLGPVVSQYTVSYLAVAGGGGGAWYTGGGGGGGGLLASTTPLSIGTVYSITVGGGGTAGNSGAAGASGSNSSIGSLVIAIGGGGTNSFGTGSNGGSGGGGSTNNNYAGGSGTSGQGNSGGNSKNSTNQGGGGGGGAGSAGASSVVDGGNGGSGSASSITGSSVTYAGGGGGGGQYSNLAGSGGSGGGGNGSNTEATASNGIFNLGGGGGGGGNNGGTVGNGGTGGAGVVILSVPTASYSGTTTGSPTITTSGSNTIIKFTSSGTYTA
jgi:hypothetical protein